MSRWGILKEFDEIREGDEEEKASGQRVFKDEKWRGRRKGKKKRGRANENGINLVGFQCLVTQSTH